MSRRPGRARFLALLPGLLAGVLAGDLAHAACLALTSDPDGAPLGLLALGGADPAFSVTYVHSVTRTPVDERYRVEFDSIVQTEIRFEQHGPGLPTAPDAGSRWTHDERGFAVTTNRRFERIVMRVHADQKPTLAAGPQAIALAQWGNRAIALAAVAGPCGGT